MAMKKLKRSVIAVFITVITAVMLLPVHYAAYSTEEAEEWEYSTSEFLLADDEVEPLFNPNLFGTFNLEWGTGTGDGWTFHNEVLTILNRAEVTISGKAPVGSGRRIVVSDNVHAGEARIILDNVDIRATSDNSGWVNHAISIHSGYLLNLTVTGENYLEAEQGAGIDVPIDSALIINGTGSLTAIGNGSVGIGATGTAGGTVNISGDVEITAAGANRSPGIGGRAVYIGGNAVVTAMGGGGGAGIGGSNFYSHRDGIIVIRGNAKVTAFGSGDSAGIGGGAGSEGGTIRIEDNAFVTANRGSAGNGMSIGAGTPTPEEPSDVSIAHTATVYVNAPSCIPLITITEQPQNTAVVEGAITETLSVSVTSLIANPVQFQWHSSPTTSTATRDPVTGETNAVFNIPKNLQSGVPHYFFASVHAEGVADLDVRSHPALVTVTAQPVVLNVVVYPQEHRIEMGQNLQLNAEVQGRLLETAEHLAVTWSLTGASASGTGISQNGLLTVAANETAKRLTVRATSDFMNGVYGETVIWIVPQNYVSTSLTVSEMIVPHGASGTVRVDIANNSVNQGFNSMVLKISFPQELTLTGFTLGKNAPIDGFYAKSDSGEDVVTPGSVLAISDEFYVGWLSTDEPIKFDGNLLNLTFKVCENAAEMKYLPITLSFENARGFEDRPIGADDDYKHISIINGGITVRTRIMGDANGDMRVTSADAVYIARHILDPVNVIISDPRAADVDGNGTIGIGDTVRLMQWLVGQDVTLAS